MLDRLKTNKMKHLVFIIFLLTFSFGSFAQKKYTTVNKKAIKNYEKAQQSNKLRNTDEALMYLEKALNVISILWKLYFFQQIYIAIKVMLIK